MRALRAATTTALTCETAYIPYLSHRCCKKRELCLCIIVHTRGEMAALPASFWRQVYAHLSLPVDRLSLKMTSKAMVQCDVGATFPYTECWDAIDFLAVADEAGQGHQHIQLSAVVACWEAVSLRGLVSLRQMKLVYGDNESELSLGSLGQYELSCVPKGVTHLQIECNNLPYNIPHTTPPDLDLSSLERLCKLTCLDMTYCLPGQRKFTATQWSCLQSLPSLQTLNLMCMHLPSDFCIPSKMLHLCLRDCTADEQLVDLNAYTTLTNVVLATNTICVQLPNSVKRLRVEYTGHEVDFERLGQPSTHLEEFVFDYQHQYIERVGSWEKTASSTPTYHTDHN